MSTNNIGGQDITWKYSTPLKADYLNILMNKVSSEGLCVRPKFSVLSSGTSVSVTIFPFSMVVHPYDDVSVSVDENGEPFTAKMVKVNLNSQVTVAIDSTHIALGFDYSFRNNGVATSQWYGDIRALTLEDVIGSAASGKEPYKGIIIGTIIHYTTSTGSLEHSVSTMGADISDLLLTEEGWDCKRWVSLISPRRFNLSHSEYDELELRCHNELYSGYMNGHMGTVFHENLRVQLPSTGTIGSKFTLVKHNTEGFSFAQSGDELPIPHTDGGVLAVYEEIGIGPGSAYFTSNGSRIRPCRTEEINLFVIENEETDTVSLVAR